MILGVGHDYFLRGKCGQVPSPRFIDRCTVTEGVLKCSFVTGARVKSVNMCVIGGYVKVDCGWCRSGKCE